VIAPAEALSTGGARERLLASVGSLMPDKVVPPTEAFPTIGTFIGIFHLMRYLMHEVGVGTKAFAVSEIFTGSLSQVRSLMI